MDDFLSRMAHREPRPRYLQCLEFLGVPRRTCYICHTTRIPSTETRPLLQFMNMIWVLVPVWLMWDSYYAIVGSLRLTYKTKSA